MKKYEFLILLVSSCLLGACRTVPSAEVKSEAPGLAASAENRAVGAYPASFRAQHRVTLTFRGRQLDFTGYLMVRRPGAWRAAAYGEFGGSLFDISVFPGRGLRLLKNPGGMRERWLKGPAADIIEILCFAEFPTGMPEALMSVKRRGEVYNIRYSDYAGFTGVGGEIPRHIVVENGKMELRLEVDLIKLEPVEIPDGNFLNE